MKPPDFATSLLIAVTGETDPNEVRKRVEECIILHDIRNSQQTLVSAAHERYSEQFREKDADRVKGGRASPETVLRSILDKCQ